MTRIYSKSSAGQLFKGFAWLAVLSCAAAQSAHAAENVKIQTFNTYSRIIFTLDSGIDAKLTPTAKGFEIFLKDANLADLGAPLGDDAEWQNQFSQTGDSRLASLQFSEVMGGVKVSGTWKFPEGEQKLVNPKMETFDFRQGSPSSYVLDFWLKKGSMTAAQYKAYQKEKERLARLARNEQEQHQRAERRIASLKRQAEIEDTIPFCKEPLSEKKDVFLEFYPVHRKVDFKRWFPVTTADEKLTYDAISGDGGSGGDEEKPETAVERSKRHASGRYKDFEYVRLALSLYQQGKYALVLRTLDFFDAEQTQSKYHTEMRFLRANTLIKLGMVHDGEEILHGLMLKANGVAKAGAAPDDYAVNDSRFALHSGMYLAYQQTARGNWLAATEAFLWLIAHYGEQPDAWVYHLGAAEALYQLKQVDRALKEYQWVIEKAPTTEDKAQAGLRFADLYMARFQYDQGLAGYYQALTAFPEQAKNFPSLRINRAEALYWLGQYDRAKAAFTDYLKDFPGDPQSWRATFRLGEIAGRQAGSAADQESREWFATTVNDFPYSPGATLARLRLIPCGDHGGFDFAAAEHFFKTDLADYHADGEIQMIPFHALQTLTYVRTLVAFSKEPQAVEAAVSEIHKPGNIEMHEMLAAALGSVFRKSILGLLAQGKKYDALAFYQDKSSALPKSAVSPDETDYLLKLSEAASDLGLGDLAKEISDRYAQMNAKPDLGRGVASADGNAGAAVPDIEARLASSEQHFAQAQALWVSLGMKEEARIREHLAKVSEESRFSYERELIYGLMDQKAGHLPQALSHAIRAQILKPKIAAATGTAGLRMEAWTAGLQAQAGDGKIALEMYQDLEKRLRESKPSKESEEEDSLGVPSVPSLEAVILAQEGLHEKQGQWGAAAATYARAVSDKLGGNRVMYLYACALRRTGVPADAAKAEALFKSLVADGTAGSGQGNTPGNSDDFWKKLAREALADGNTKSLTP